MCEVCPGRQVVDANLSYSSQCRASLKACISSCGLMVNWWCCKFSTYSSWYKRPLCWGFLSSLPPDHSPSPLQPDVGLTWTEGFPIDWKKRNDCWYLPDAWRIFQFKEKKQRWNKKVTFWFQHWNKHCLPRQKVVWGVGGTESGAEAPVFKRDYNISRYFPCFLNCVEKIFQDISPVF